jgi:hypothetical protein
MIRTLLTSCLLWPSAGLPTFHYAPDAGDGTAGGAGETADKKPDAKADDKKPDAKKVELTEEELEQRITARLEAERKKTADKVAKDKEEADRKAAEDQGKFKELAEKEKADRLKLQAENRQLRMESTLRDHLASKHPEYASVAKYILPTVPVDTADADLPKAIEAAAAQYVKDNPRQAARGPGPGPSRTGIPSGGTSTAGNRQSADPDPVRNRLRTRYPGPPQPTRG